MQCTILETTSFFYEINVQIVLKLCSCVECMLIFETNNFIKYKFCCHFVAVLFKHF